MVDEQEFHYVALRGKRALRLRLHLHAIGDRRRARRLRLGHRSTAHFDLDHAHAAVGGDRQLLVIAKTRNRHTDAISRLDDHRTLRRKHLLAIDLDGDVIRRHVGGHRLGAHAATSILASTIERPCVMKYSNSCQ